MMAESVHDGTRPTGRRATHERSPTPLTPLLLPLQTLVLVAILAEHRKLEMEALGSSYLDGGVGGNNAGPLEAVAGIALAVSLFVSLVAVGIELYNEHKLRVLGWMRRDKNVHLRDQLFDLAYNRQLCADYIASLADGDELDAARSLEVLLHARLSSDTRTGATPASFAAGASQCSMSSEPSPTPPLA